MLVHCYVHIYVHVCVSMYVCKYVRQHIQVCVCCYVRIMYTCICFYASVHMNIHTYAFYACTCSNACIYVALTATLYMPMYVRCMHNMY